MTSKPMKRMTIQYTGDVQGVGFRYSTVRMAERYPVTGYVQNQSDGTVRLVAEGAETYLCALRQDIHDSHLGAYITSENLSWSESTGEFRTFGVKYGY